MAKADKSNSPKPTPTERSAARKELLRHRISQFRAMRDQQMQRLQDLRKQKFSDVVTLKRKRLSVLVLLGFVITLALIVADATRSLSYLENRLYDVRCRWFQFFTPPPSPAVFLLDIDDDCYDRIGRFPWDRSMMAEFVDEIRLAGPKVVMLDILYSEPELKDREDPTVVGPGDKRLAEALEELGNVVLAVSLQTDTPAPLTPMQKAMIEELTANIDIDKGGLAERLRNRGFDTAVMAKEVEERFISARREAIRGKIALLLQQSDAQGRPVPTVADVQRTLLPNVPEYVFNLPTQIAILEELPAVLKARAMKQHGRLPPVNLTNLFFAPTALFPIEPFTNAVKIAGFVDYLKGGDAVVRDLPLFVNHKGTMFPAAGLAAALSYLDVPLDAVTFTDDEVVIPVKDAEPIKLRVRTVNDSDAGRVPMVMSIPWFGGSEQKYMYDHPKYTEIKQRKSMMAVYNAREARRKLDFNYDSVWKMCRNILCDAAGVERSVPKEDILTMTFPPERQQEGGRLQTFYKSEYFPDRRDDLISFARGTAIQRRSLPLLRQKLSEQFATAADDQTKHVIQEKLTEIESYAQLIDEFAKQIPALKDDLTKVRDELAKDLKDKAVFVGLTATGAVDIYPMPLFASAPGVLVHGAVFNGIVTRQSWVHLPWWVTGFFILAMGTVVTLVVTSMSPFPASTITAVLMVGYAVFNGLLLFDYMNFIAGMAGPLLAAGVVWATLTLLRYFLEMAERERLTRRFRSYVDPQLVNYVQKHPEVDVQAGEMREMSVVFTDLEGFTTLSERLRERTVGMLSDYMSEMVPLIRANSGFVNKFLGDGIMFFYNAPVQPNPNHAFDAVKTILELQRAMGPFNEKLKAQDLPTLNMRAGMTSGAMVVGDAGSTSGSDYTVLGDSVNLSARLEGANKITGTACLMVKRTVELLGDRVIFRPVANLQVKGKVEAVITYEPMCLKGEETPAITAVVNHSRAVYDAFVAGNFAGCLAATEAMTAALGPTKFAKLYAEQAKHYLEEGTPENFDGRIALDSK